MSQSINRVELAGEVERVFDWGKVVMVKIKTSFSSGGEMRTAKLDVKAFGQLADKLKKCHQGDFLHVVGNLKVSKREDRQTGAATWPTEAIVQQIVNHSAGQHSGMINAVQAGGTDYAEPFPDDDIPF